ncbi:uncharacterized protein LOC110460574 isoform X4 [Mizuhopecten yessoensis]|uniref:uncharacterized protein LOC110460574 isoform X4 n=1 Tax=Mizuhopecten yessoensis TaxID=6573 RepID=UPI000B45ED75|nr:uncharacterized protein LOC110460574 isoform X4 [Mizuhopecten yessoensis]XP_021369228.1 uncharacterized protein LOC110460574 isoform X4 [Mizuhopecten yessoensis]
MENKCGFCDKKTLSLRRCSACQQVYYCSTVCQREDWKLQHKAKCKEIQKRKQSEQADNPKDSGNIPNSGSATGGTLYPSEPAHGIPHEVCLEYIKKNKLSLHIGSDLLSNSALFFDGNLNEHSNEEGTGRTGCKICVVCGKASDAVKTCARCKMVDYCSKKCQRQDWKSHKLLCRDPEEDVYESITTDGYRREEAFASESARSTGSGSFNRPRPLPKSPDLSDRSYVKPGALDKVKSLTWKTFPGCIIVDFVREIPHEHFGMRPRGTSRVAVGFISRYHTYVLRHCVYLQDKDRDEVYVAFYLNHDEPRPYFRWSDVVPGRYLCIADPYIHQFLDGSVGIRVDDPSTVRVFAV